MDLQDKKVAVIGVGKTGLATARFLANRGARIVLTDVKPEAAWQESVAALLPPGAQWSAGPYGTECLAGVDLVVPSPGIYPTHPILTAAQERGIPILSELELAYRFLQTPLVAITGTNGKTTVTTLIGEILRAAGKEVFVGGNIGAPLIGYTDGPQEADWAVVEVSSFQLQWAESFHPHIALLLHVTSDHVDYHGSFAAYRAVKERIFARQDASDLAILNADDAGTAALADRLTAQRALFCSTGPVARGMYLSGAQLIHVLPSGEREEYPREMIGIPGLHNVENVMAAILAARGCGCDPATIRRAVEGFRGIAHRIEYAGEQNGVAFYDDSKGTNVGAVVRAIESFSRPIVLLLGGRDKEGDFATLVPLIRERVRQVVLFGEAREKIHALIGDAAATTLAPTLQEAVAAAWGLARPGDIVLLSPGCASFDEFTDYKARGRAFREWVGQLSS
ncbi:MAG: UDP-N-acetylmuramoyl-L-alanine--D-glutamate ligase [Deltaproteobacteria bacterium]|nr:UDP-N-acetylmuramoyl-L-alanine--D-glutamate ligase [Deltaproteobacteria bacterium]